MAMLNPIAKMVSPGAFINIGSININLIPNGIPQNISRYI